MIRVKITNKNGLHARPACFVTSIALKFSGKVYLKKNGVYCNAKSIMEIMSLELICGDVVDIIAYGTGGDKVERMIAKSIHELKD